MIKDSTTIEINGRSYNVKFPNVGEYYQIESLKQSLSRGFYNSMVMSPSAASQTALDMIDIEATMSILCPDFIKDLKVKNFSELGIRDYKVVRDAYYKDIAPFFKEIHDLLRNGADVEQGED